MYVSYRINPKQASSDRLPRGITGWGRPGSTAHMEIILVPKGKSTKARTVHRGDEKIQPLTSGAISSYHLCPRNQARATSQAELETPECPDDLKHSSDDDRGSFPHSFDIPIFPVESCQCRGRLSDSHFFKNHGFLSAQLLTVLTLL